MATMDDLEGLRSLDELLAFRDEIISERAELNQRFGVKPFDDEARAQFAALTEIEKETTRRVNEYTARTQIVTDTAKNPNSHEGPELLRTQPRASRIPENIYDTSAYRDRARSMDDLRGLYRDGARRALDTMSFPHERARKEDVQTHVNRLLERDYTGELAERILNTDSPIYKRAFAKKLAGVGLSTEEERALSLTTTAGGFAVPVTLDPTVIPTSNGVVNPIRRVARVITITGNTWEGITSAGVSAAYGAELTEASDNAPTIAQPTINVEKAQAFIPFSIEIGEDWGGMASEMAQMLQDAKDQLEATQFITGLGHASTAPQGLLVGATAVVSTAAATTLAVADLYSLEEGLPPRFRPNAVIVGNRKQFNRVRQFDTAGGSSLWVQLGDGLPRALIGYPTYEASEMSSALTTGASIITIGDFSHYVIVDRIGMNVELIPHMFATANNRPSGQRGLYAYWRNSAGVTAWQAFRTLKVT